jgi:hypothetical protein
MLLASELNSLLKLSLFLYGAVVSPYDLHDLRAGLFPLIPEDPQLVHPGAWQMPKPSSLPECIGE